MPAAAASASSASKPFLMPSWCEPENAVYTSSPAYGWRGWTGSWFTYSVVRRISSMLEKSIIGSMPWLNRFRPSVTRQTLPVRSPLPNRHPSIRSAPASTASSASATAVPRSLWVWTETQTLSRLLRCRLIHSIWSAYAFGVGGASDGARQVEDDLAVLGRLPEVHHGLAGLQGEVQLGVHEDLGRVLVAEVGPRGGATSAEDLLRVVHHVPGAVD